MAAAGLKLFERSTSYADALPDMPALIGELSVERDLFLVSEYPPEWLLPALDKSELAARFEADRIAYTAELACGASLFENLVRGGVIIPGHTIWVNTHSRRTTEALQAGIDAAIFVDAARLRRDLVLWRLLA